MGYSNKTNRKNNMTSDLYPDDFKVKIPKVNFKKRQCAGCGKLFTPAMKLDYCCNQCKIENSEMFSQYSDLGY